MESQQLLKPTKWPLSLKAFVFGTVLTSFVYGVMCVPIGYEGSGDNMGFRTVVGLFYLALVLPTALVFALVGKSVPIHTGVDIPFWFFCINALINGCVAWIIGWLVGLTQKFDR
jgi:hypothetical protein